VSALPSWPRFSRKNKSGMSARISPGIGGGCRSWLPGGTRKAARRSVTSTVYANAARPEADLPLPTTDVPGHQAPLHGLNSLVRCNVPRLHELQEDAAEAPGVDERHEATPRAPPRLVIDHRQARPLPPSDAGKDGVDLPRPVGHPFPPLPPK